MRNTSEAPMGLLAAGSARDRVSGDEKHAARPLEGQSLPEPDASGSIKLTAGAKRLVRSEGSPA